MDGTPTDLLTERIVLRRTLGGLDVVDFEEDEPFDLIRFHRWRARAWFGEGEGRPRWDVVRRGWIRQDIGLFRGRELRAVARRRRVFPTAYTVAWDGRRLTLEQSPGHPGWRLLDGDEAVGGVTPRPFTKGETDVELPPDTPDEVTIFVACVALITRRYSIARLAASLTQGVPDY